MKLSARFALSLGICSLLRAASAPDPLQWKAGAAAADITPEGAVWMAGYGFRKKPSEGVSQKLHAKALALEDARGTPMVVVTLDLIGFGYLGSRRVIVEGGYEGYSANLGRHPGPWATTTEDRVINLVYELSRSINH